MDVTFLQPVYEYPGPFSSLYLNVSRDAEDAAEAIRVRWGKAREELAEQGEAEQSLRALDGVVGRSEGYEGPCGQVAFARDGEVVFDVLVDSPPQDRVARFGPLPHPLPFLAHRGEHVPHVLVVADSTGADLTAVDLAGRRRGTRVDPDEPVHKPRGGANKHKQIQRSADEKLHQNAETVAAETARVAVRGGAELVVLAGDVQACKAVSDQLPDGLRERTVQAETGSRAPGSAASPLGAELARVLREHADGRVGSVVDEFERQREQADRGTEGLAPTVYALQRGQVDTLLWSEDMPGGGDQLWIGPRPEHLGMSVDELRRLGVQDPTRERADAALIRAAAATSANLVFVPTRSASLSEGIGALLRFSDPTLPG